MTKIHLKKSNTFPLMLDLAGVFFRMRDRFLSSCCEARIQAKK